MIQFIYLIIFVQATRIYQIQNESLNFQLPVNQPTKILTLEQAKDSKLISNSSSPSCELQQLHLIFDTKTQIFESIVTMAHIRDGILVITSDYYLYMLKFNYAGNQTKFIDMVWKADFKELGLQVKNEMPDLIYSSSSNMGLLFYSQSLMIFSIQQMEQKQGNLQVREVSDLKLRKERGVTKVVDNFIFSCVGQEGLDIYRIMANEIHFIGQIYNYRVKDLAIIKMESLFYLILLDDLKPCIAVFEMEQSKTKVQFTLQFEIITPRYEFIAIDNYGSNIFIAYELHNRYKCEEYLFTTKELTLLNQFQTFSRIKDVDVTEDFAILQGQNKHHIMFVTKFKDFTIKHVTEYIQPDVIDIDFFTLTSIDLKMSHIKDQQDQLFNFFFGVSKSGIFMTKYKIKSPQVECFSSIESIQYYQIISNESVFNNHELMKNSMIQRTTNVTVSFQIQSDLSYFGLFLYLGIPIVVTIFGMGTCYWLINQMKEIERLETEVATIKSKKSSGLAVAVEVPQIMQVIGQVPTARSPFTNTHRLFETTKLQKDEKNEAADN